MDRIVHTDRYFVRGSGENVSREADTVCRTTAIYSEPHFQWTLYLDPVWPQESPTRKYRYPPRTRDAYLGDGCDIPVCEMDHVDAGTVSLVGRLCDDRPTRNNLFKL